MSGRTKLAEGKTKENYAWVAEATAAFATQEQTSG
jgi:hypothetical protein